MSNQLQNKLLHYEIPPSEGVWNKIAVSLDENISPTVSDKLYRYAEQPSPIVWQNVSSQLDNPVTQKTKVLPFYVRYRRPLKYSGAVAIFIFLAVTTSLLISKKTESELPAEGVVNSTLFKKDTAKPPQQNSKELENNFVVTSKENKSGPLIAKSKPSRTRQEELQNSFSSFENLFPQQAEKNKTVSSSLPSDKYMIYSDDDGNVVRLPKKIFSAFACPTNDLICKQHLQQLKEKFAQSAMTADFTGLLQILKSLQENQ